MGSIDQNSGRSRDYSERLPTHYCSSCSTVVFDDDTSCLECGVERPENGWEPIQDGPDTWIGRVLDGRYLVTRRVGQGSAGAVYRADSLAISRRFAIKVINFKQTPSGLDAEQVRTRLHREIEALGRLRNPHIVPFYEVLELFGNFVAIVMDYVEGKTLEALVEEEGAMPPKRAAALLRQIANGVHEAHEAGMIHRDLKPENLMVERMPAGDDFVHILDFGIVRMDDGVSMTRGFLGTPLYASPEQAMAGEIDRRSDVYSLGAIFFFMLTGRPPFVSENVYDILRAHVRSKAPTLSEVAEQDFAPELESLVGSMLSKSPNSRPQSLASVIKKIDVLVKSGNLDLDPSRQLKDSVELQPIEPNERETGGFPRIGSEVTGFKRDDTDSRLKIQAEQSGESGQPEAGIFKGRTRTSVKRALDESRKEMEQEPVDRVVDTDTGVFSLGLGLQGVLDAGATGGGSRLFFLDPQGNITLGSISDDETVAIEAGIKGATCIACSGDHIVVGTSTGEVIQILEDESRVLFQDVRQAAINAIALDASGDHVIVGSDSGRVYMGSLSGRGRNWDRVQNGSPVMELDISGSGDNFAVAREHGEVELYTTSSPRSAFGRFSVRVPVKHLAFSKDGHLLAVLRDDGLIELRLTMTGSKMASLQAAERDVVALAFDQTGGLIGFFMEDGMVNGIDLQRELVRSS